MNSQKTILIVGNVYDNHIIRFVRYLSSHSSDICIDLFNTTQSLRAIPSFSGICRNVYSPFPQFLSVFFNVPKVRVFVRQVCLFFSYWHLSNKRYDLLNIQNVSSDAFYGICFFRKMSNTILLSPWGSDVYSISESQKRRISKLYALADNVSLTCSNFKIDVMNMFNVPDSKIVALSVGSEMIDIIRHNSTITLDDAKSHLGLLNRYIIAVGYQGSTHQNHIQILHQLMDIHNSLPHNVTLLIQVTYGLSDAYKKSLTDALNDSKFDYVILDRYLNDLELLYVRKAVDLFIHVEDTDANSATLQEYLLCGTKIINGSWLKYPQLEHYGLPYYVIQSISEIRDNIVGIIEDQSLQIDARLKDEILAGGYAEMGKEWINYIESC